MPKYMLHASYTTEGIKSLLKEKASARVAAAKAAFESAGAKLESIHFAFGADDIVAIVDAPDNITAAALSVTFGAAGMIRGRTIPLLTVEEMDKALAKEVSYQAPGSAR